MIVRQFCITYAVWQGVPGAASPSVPLCRTLSDFVGLGPSGPFGLIEAATKAVAEATQRQRALPITTHYSPITGHGGGRAELGWAGQRDHAQLTLLGETGVVCGIFSKKKDHGMCGLYHQSTTPGGVCHGQKEFYRIVV